MSKSAFVVRLDSDVLFLLDVRAAKIGFSRNQLMNRVLSSVSKMSYSQLLALITESEDIKLT